VMEEYIEVKRELVEYAMALLEQNCKGSVSNELRALLAAAPKADVQEPVGYGKPDAFIWKDFTTGKQVVSIDRAPHGSRPLYAAPQPVSDERDTLRPHAELLLVALETLSGACRNAEIFHGLTKHAESAIYAYRAAMESKGDE